MWTLLLRFRKWMFRRHPTGRVEEVQLIGLCRMASFSLDSSKHPQSEGEERATLEASAMLGKDTTSPAGTASVLVLGSRPARWRASGL